MWEQKQETGIFNVEKTKDLDHIIEVALLIHAYIYIYIYIYTHSLHNHHSPAIQNSQIRNTTQVKEKPCVHLAQATKPCINRSKQSHHMTTSNEKFRLNSTKKFNATACPRFCKQWNPVNYKFFLNVCHSWPEKSNHHSPAIQNSQIRNITQVKEKPCVH